MNLVQLLESLPALLEAFTKVLALVEQVFPNAQGLDKIDHAFAVLSGALRTVSQATPPALPAPGGPAQTGEARAENAGA